VRPTMFLVVLLTIGAGCQHSVPPTTSFSFVDPAHYRGPTIDASKYKITKVEGVYVDAKPIEPLAAPKYPPAALGAQKWPVSVTVNINVGTDGLVSYVGQSMAAVSIPTEFDREFLDAIKASLSQWRFEPAHLVHLAPQPNGPPMVVDFTDVETTFDVAFTFYPGGKVSSSSATKPNR
jgi:hypothetical protein